MGTPYVQPAELENESEAVQKSIKEMSFRIQITGKAAHAGGNHQQGLNAIGELARHIVTLENMTDYHVGTTINVGVVT